VVTEIEPIEFEELRWPDSSTDPSRLLFFSYGYSQWRNYRGLGGGASLAKGPTNCHS